MQTLGDCTHMIQPLRLASLLSPSPGITISSKLFTMSSTLAEGHPQQNEQQNEIDNSFVSSSSNSPFSKSPLSLADLADRRLFVRRR